MVLDGIVHRSHFSFVAYVTGIAGLNLAAAMLLPMAVDLIDGNPDWQAFLLSSAIVGFFSLMAVLTFSGRTVPFSRRFGFLLINSLWVGATLAASLPYQVSVLHLGFGAAIFETVSGLTTTGSTVLHGLDTMPRGLLLWRSMTQWIGGIGIIAMGLFLLPFLRVGGMQVYRMESSAQDERPVARFSQFAADMLIVYAVLTLACALGYRLAGMGAFDALNHAMTTISTGGFSTHDTSMSRFGRGVHLVAIVFMIAGALPFTAILRAIVTRNPLAIYDPQIPVFLAVLAGFSTLAFISGNSAMDHDVAGLAINSVFSVVSVITTTGFASTDYLTWGTMTVGVFLIATFLGGCTGSTAGGLKTFRLIILFRSLRLGLNEVIFPRGTFLIRYAGRQMSEQALRAVGVFAFAMVTIVLLASLGMMSVGMDFETAFSAALTALTNTGPGLSKQIGPSGNFGLLPEPALWIMSVTMLLGRLEIITVLVLATPTFWRG